MCINWRKINRQKAIRVNFLDSTYCEFKRKKTWLKITVFIFYRLYLAHNVGKFYRKVKFIYDNYIHIFPTERKIVITVFLLQRFIHAKQFNCIKDWWMRGKLHICLIESTRYTFMLSERELYIYVEFLVPRWKKYSNKKKVLGKVNRRTGS